MRTTCSLMHTAAQRRARCRRTTTSKSSMAIASYQDRITRRLVMLVLLLLAATLLAALATQYWLFELLTHFTPLFAVAALLCALMLALMGAWRWMLFALALGLWNGYAPAQMLLRNSLPPGLLAQTGQLTVFHLNVGLHHEQPSRIVSYLQRRAKTIDVVVLLEVTSDFEPALEELRDVFPYQVVHLEDSPFGIALASRQPLDFGAVAFIPSELYPHVEATLKLPGRTMPLALYALHAPPPISAEFARARNAKLQYIARQAAAQAKATPVVVGDFNMTPWSPYFARFRADSGLTDTRAPHRLDHTWPVTFNNAHMGFAIDHSFAHPSLRVIKRVIGPDLGSDHLPVTVTLAY
jgi:endonuclease/exonuclease/phosphatase (EEP) superfamily protein YafD